MTQTTKSFQSLLLPAVLLLAACSSMYYSTMESFGVHKRDILADRVEAGRDSQEDAKEQFQTTLEAFKDTTGFDGGDLEDFYGKINGEYERCEARANAVHERIEGIEDVAEALFSEWKAEIEEFTSAEHRSRSEEMLRDTQDRYASLMNVMRKAEDRMTPVLKAFRNEVMLLKHSLNAQAIASLQANVTSIESDLAVLVRDMEASIAEADAFIESLG